MPIKILMPALSPTMSEGNLAKWLIKEGDKIAPGQVIAEIETDKATMEVEAVDEGVIAKILVPAGTENVAVNSLIAVLLEEGEDAGALKEFELSANEVASKEVQTKQDPSLLEPRADNSNTGETNSNSKSVSTPNANLASTATGRVFASPLAKRLASMENLDLACIKGSGPHGRIIKADVLNAAQNKGSASFAGTSLRQELVRNPEEYRLAPNSNVRKIIAKRLLESKQSIPHFYLSIECNIDKLLEARQDLNDIAGDDKAQKLSVNDFVILAVAKALRDVPEANASWDEAAIRYYNNVDVSVAVAIDGGLITPVIKNADQKSLALISKEMKDLAKRARENKLAPEEFQGGGFTISNLGMYNIKNFSAIINPPQSCILAVGQSSKRPIIVDDAVTIATIMDVTLSCDHRVVDGAVGARLLAAFKKYLEKPLLLFV